MTIPFRVEHLEQLERQKGMIYSKISNFNRRLIEESSTAYTVTASDRILMCAGIIPYWNNRAEGWAMFDHNLKSYFVTAHRAVVKFLDSTPCKRIECVVNRDFEQGHRWAKALGFKIEAHLMKTYFEDGSDAVLYARVR